MSQVAVRKVGSGEVKSRSLMDNLKAIEERIRTRAYQLFKAHCFERVLQQECPDGNTA